MSVQGLLQMWLLSAVCPDVGVQRLPSAAAMVGRVFFCSTQRDQSTALEYSTVCFSAQLRVSFHTVCRVLVCYGESNAAVSSNNSYCQGWCTASGVVVTRLADQSMSTGKGRC